MRSLVTILLLTSLVPGSAHAQAMIEVPPPSDRPSPSSDRPSPSSDRPSPPSPPSSALPAAAAPSAVAPLVERQEAFDHRFIAFEDWVAYNVHTGVVVNAWSKPVEGKYRKPLSYGEFYERVGRPDLADRYRTRRNLKIGFAVAGSVAIIAGLGAIAGQIFSNSSSFDRCVDVNIDRNGAAGCQLQSGSGGYVAGGILMGAGAAAMIAGLATSLQPAQPYEAREMADRYNAKLHQELGLDAPPAAAPAPAPTAGTSFTLAPSVDQKGASLRLVARF